MHFEVFYVDPKNGWAAAEFDDDDNQIGDAAFHFHKRDALREARYMSQGVFPIHIFGKDGSKQRTV